MSSNNCVINFDTRVRVNNCQTYVRGYVYVHSNPNGRIKISRKRHIFIFHVKIHALPAVYADVNILIHASKVRVNKLNNALARDADHSHSMITG